MGGGGLKIAVMLKVTGCSFRSFLQVMNCWISSKGASKCNYGNAVFLFELLYAVFSRKTQLELPADPKEKQKQHKLEN